MLVNTLEEFNALDVEFVSLKDKIDTTSPVGKMTFAVIAAMAEMERDIMSERIKSGIEARRRNGKQIGRPSKGEELKPEIMGLRVQKHSFREIGRQLDVHPSTVSKIIKQYGEPEEVQTTF
jgi:DNA invertase Pin-like site-specific DNA recombinase